MTVCWFSGLTVNVLMRVRTLLVVIVVVVEVMSATLLVTWKEARSNSWCGDPAGVPLRRRSFRLDLPTESANEEAAEIPVNR